MGLAAVVAATLLQSMDNANKVFPEMATMPIALVILIVCAIGAVIGLINGLIIAYLNVTPFITTLGTMIIVYGINSLYYDFVGASPISGFDSGFSTFAQGFIALGSFRLSYITFYALIAVVFVWVLWNKTRFGKNIFAIGGNPEAAKVSGVNVGLNLLMIDRVLYIGITLRLKDEATRSRLSEYLPEVRSRLLLLFSRQDAAVLATEEGKKNLIAEIKTTLSTPLVAGQPKQDVTDVLYTAFILR